MSFVAVFFVIVTAMLSVDDGLAEKSIPVDTTPALSPEEAKHILLKKR